MAGNATPSRLGKRKYNSSEDWDNFKEEIYRVYVLEDRTLELTMKHIEKMNGPRAKERRWNEKLDEWNFKKNISTYDRQWMCAKRIEFMEKGIETVFFHRNNEVAADKLDGFERRKIEAVPLHVEKPPDVVYFTIMPKKSLSVLEEMLEDLSTFSTSTREDHASLESARNTYTFRSFQSAIGTQFVTKIETPQVPFIKRVSGWLSDQHSPWSPKHLPHQPIEYEDATTSDYNNILGDISVPETTLNRSSRQDSLSGEFLHVLARQNYLPALDGVGDHLALNLCVPVEDNQQSEDEPLNHLFSLEVTLPKLQATHGRFASTTLKHHFDMAKALEAFRMYEEAEFHCRQITNLHPQTEVEIFLGLILAKCQRFQESMALLIRALTSFIIHFDIQSLHKNATLVHEIEFLCTELVLLGEGDHAGWSLCLCQLMTTLKETSSECALSRIHPQLFIHGFSFAYEFSLVGFTESAGWMYEDLLHNCLGVLDIVHHALVKASAHQRFGALLRKQERWRSSADQLLLACKSSKYSEKIDRKFCRELEMDYLELTPYLEDSMTQQLTEALEYIRPYLLLPLGDASEPAGSSRVAEFMKSDLPISFRGFRRSELDQLDEFAAPPRVTVPPNKIRELIILTSSASLSGSGNLVTWSDSDWEYAGIPGLSDGVSTTS